MDQINNRFIDVIIALSVAQEYEQVIGRIQLQKFIYLSDTIAATWSVLAPKNGHETYKHGPYDDSINNAVDALAFRGFVTITNMRMEERRVDAQYEINRFGIKIFEELAAESHFQNKVYLYRQIGMHVNSVGWKKLKELVYAEPTYVQSKATGYGYKFDYLSLFTNESLRILYQLENLVKSGHQISRENMVSLFFKLIA